MPVCHECGEFSRRLVPVANLRVCDGCADDERCGDHRAE